MNILGHDKSTTVQRLAEQFRVSASTIRRDLTSMEDSGLVKRSHGGVVLVENVQRDLDFDDKKTKDYELKKEIGRFAAGLVEDGDIIALNSSTITTMMAEHLDAADITVVTNSINILNIIRRRTDYQIIVLGGVYMANAQTIEGPTTTEQIEQLHFDKVFFGANGVDVQFGLSSASELEAKSKMAMIKHTKKTYCLCENAKFTRSSLFKIADLADVDAIITDWQIDRDILREYGEYANIVVAEPVSLARV